MTGTPLHIVLAAGGTGGHVFPAEALAEALLARGHRLTLVTDRRGQSYGGTLGRIETLSVCAGGIAGKGLMGRLRGGLELAFGVVQAWRLLRRLRPDAVVGFGGYASLPGMVAAIRLGLPTVIHEQNAVPGRTNRLLARRVSLFCTALPHARCPVGTRSAPVGMPVRPTVLALREAPYAPPGAEAPFTLLVTGGSQGAHVFSTLIPDALARLPAPLRAGLRLVQQARAEDMEALTPRLEALGLASMEVSPFFTDLPERLAGAHLAICRAGASTVGELTALGRPAILVPYPHATDDHQTANAQGLSDAGAAWLMPQATLDGEALAARLGSLLEEPALLARAAACARELGVPDAAERLAARVEAVARQGALPNGNGSTVTTAPPSTRQTEEAR